VLVAPLLFMVMNKHSVGACAVGGMPDPKRLIEAQIDLALHGLAPAPAAVQRPARRSARPVAAPGSARRSSSAVGERPAPKRR